MEIAAFGTHGHIGKIRSAAYLQKVAGFGVILTIDYSRLKEKLKIF
jgi:hypothetical protein